MKRVNNLLGIEDIGDLEFTGRRKEEELRTSFDTYFSSFFSDTNELNFDEARLWIFYNNFMNTSFYGGINNKLNPILNPLMETESFNTLKKNNFLYINYPTSQKFLEKNIINNINTHKSFNTYKVEALLDIPTEGGNLLKVFNDFSNEFFNILALENLRKTSDIREFEEDSAGILISFYQKDIIKEEDIPYFITVSRLFKSESRSTWLFSFGTSSEKYIESEIPRIAENLSSISENFIIERL